MSSRLERLIKLAQKTGGTLIIQGNEKQRDVVVISVDEYEWMAENQRDPFDFDFRHDDVRELSEAELLDRINRDIGIWRANKEQEEQRTREEMLEAETPFDPFAEDFAHPSDWHRACDIIGEKYGDFSEDEIKISDIPDFGFLDEDEEEDENDAPFKIEDIPFDVPFKAESDLGVLTEEEAGDDEPIFFEEPIE